MKLRVENFGPISYADVEIKPLTVLIGKNNAGKSMLAQLIFTLMTLTEGYISRRFLTSMLQHIRTTEGFIAPYLRQDQSIPRFMG
jgi:predicted ATPase